MKAVVDRIVQYANRYKLTNAETGEVLGTFDFDEVTGTVQQVGTEIDKELFDSIANDLAARVVSAGGELSGTIVTFSDISGTAENVASGDTSATLWGKVKNWFSRLKALAFKNKVAAGDFEAGAIKNADVAADAAIAQSKVSGLMTDYVASISVSGRTVTYKNKNGVDMGSITTQDTTYGLASQSSNGLMSSTDKTKLDGIESGAQKNTVLGVKGGSESAYRTGNVNITKANIGLGNVDNTSDEDKPVSAATQMALNGKANTSGTYLNLTVGKATNADNATNATKATQDGSGNNIASTYATKTELTEGLAGKQPTGNYALQNGTYPNMTVGNATNAVNATKATQDGSGNNIVDTYVDKATEQVITGRKVFYGDVTPLNVKYETQETGDTFSYAPVTFYDNADKKLGSVQGQKTGNGMVQTGIDVYNKDGNYAASMGLKWDYSTQRAFPFAPSGQTVVQNGDSSDKIVCSEFLQPGMVYDSGYNYGYRGKNYFIAASLYFAPEDVKVMRSGNVVIVSGWARLTRNLVAGTGYAVINGLPTVVGGSYGEFIFATGTVGVSAGRVWMQGNSLYMATNISESNPQNGWLMSFSLVYVTNE